MHHVFACVAQQIGQFVFSLSVRLRDINVTPEGALVQ